MLQSCLQALISAFLLYNIPEQLKLPKKLIESCGLSGRSQSGESGDYLDSKAPTIWSTSSPNGYCDRGEKGYDGTFSYPSSRSDSSLQYHLEVPILEKPSITASYSVASHSVYFNPTPVKPIPIQSTTVVPIPVVRSDNTNTKLFPEVIPVATPLDYQSNQPIPRMTTPNYGPYGPNPYAQYSNPDAPAPVGYTSSQQNPNVLLNPDEHYFNGNNQIPASPYPQPEQPKGQPIVVNFDFDKNEDKSKRTALGLGVGAAALVLTGGLVFPLIAGSLVYNELKKSARSHYLAYPNTYVYELRVALSAELKIRPELILLKKKDTIMDDNEHLSKYYKSYQKKIAVHVAICGSPVPGSNYYAPNGAFYPTKRSVNIIKSAE